MVIKPDKAILERLYLQEENSTTDIGKLYRVGPRQANHWLVQDGIPMRTKAEGIQLAMIKRHEKAAQLAIQNEQLNIANEDGSPSELVRQQPLPIAPLDPPPDTAYSRLNRNQQLAIELLSQFDESMTYQQVADDVGVELQTLGFWRKQSDFQIALDEAQKPNFISELKGLSRRDLLDRFKTGIGLTREDRVVAFKLTNDLGSDSSINVNTQINFSNGW